MEMIALGSDLPVGMRLTGGRLVVDGHELGRWLSSRSQPNFMVHPPGQHGPGTTTTSAVRRWNAWLCALRQGHSYLLSCPVQINELTLEDACVTGIDLSGLRLRGGHWERVVAAQADLRGTEIRDASLRSVNFHSADLRELHSERVHYELCQLDRVEIAATVFRDCTLRTTQLRDFTSNTLSYSGLRDPVGLQMIASVLDGVRLQNVTLQHALLQSCELSAITLRGALLQGVRLNSLNFGYIRDQESSASLWEHSELQGCSFSSISGSERVLCHDVVARGCRGIATALHAPRPGIVITGPLSELRPQLPAELRF